MAKDKTEVKRLEGVLGDFNSQYYNFKDKQNCDNMVEQTLNFQKLPDNESGGGKTL